MTQSASSVSVSLGASAPASQAPAIPGWEHRSSGKVRDIYSPTAEGPWAGQDVLLVVASDRISAYDHILSTPIPDKGRVLTALSAWWFEQLADVVPGHLVSLDVPAQVSGRAMICRRLEMYPVECVARGYLTGSGLAEYRESRSVCGVPLPEGLTEASRLPEPIFTPAAKAELGEHDEHYPFHRDGLATNDLAHRFPKELLSFRSTFLHAEPQPSCEFPVKVFGKTPSQLDLKLQLSSSNLQTLK